MTDYPLNAITLNNREVLITDIQNSRFLPGTEFEKDTALFIKEWLDDTTHFQLHTSGSTGTPKEVSFTRDQLMASAQGTIRALNLKEGSTSLVCLNTRYVAGKMMLVRSLINNMKIVAVEPAANPLEVISQDFIIDFTALVPLQVKDMIDHGFAERLNSIGTIIIGGAAISNSLRTSIQQHLTTAVYGTYGMTETLSHVALQSLHHHDEGHFKTMPGVIIETDDRGCLVLQVPYLPESVITNDLVEITGSDTFRWKGRIDTVINSGGVKIIPEQVEPVIETIFKSLGIDQNFFISSRPDPILGNAIILIIESESLTADREAALMKMLREKLNKYEIPKAVIPIKRFLYTKTGKISRVQTMEIVNNSNKTLQ